MGKRFNGRSGNPLIRLIIGVVVLLGGVGLVLYHGPWVRSVVQGPVSTTLADLEGLEDPKTLSNPWISLTFNEAMNTGLIMESTKSGITTPRSKYLLIRVGPRANASKFLFLGNSREDFREKSEAVSGHLAFAANAFFGRMTPEHA